MPLYRSFVRNDANYYIKINALHKMCFVFSARFDVAVAEKPIFCEQNETVSQYC